MKMKVKDFLKTITLKDYFAISINELVESREYSSDVLSIVVYDTENIINILSDTFLNKTFSHAHISVSDDNEIELYIYVLRESEETVARALRAFSDPMHADVNIDALAHAVYLMNYCKEEK